MDDDVERTSHPSARMPPGTSCGAMNCAVVRAEKTLTNGLRLVKDFQIGSNYLVHATVRLENTSSGPLVLSAQEWVVGTATPMGPDDKGDVEGVIWYNGSKTEEKVRSWFDNKGFLFWGGVPHPEFRAGQISPAGLFVYQFEVVSRNRLGYDAGLDAMKADPVYNDAWREFLDIVKRQLGLVDFSDLIYARSAWYIKEQQHRDPNYESPREPLFGEKEGKIARANMGRDPLYLFAALQRQLGYPEVPRPRTREDVSVKIETLQTKVRDLEMRLKLLESEMRGTLDLSKLVKPEQLLDPPDEAW